MQNMNARAMAGWQYHSFSSSLNGAARDGDPHRTIREDIVVRLSWLCRFSHVVCMLHAATSTHVDEVGNQMQVYCHAAKLLYPTTLLRTVKDGA